QIETVLKEKKESAAEKIKLDFDEAALQAGQYGVSDRTKEQITSHYKNLLSSLEAYTDIYKVDALITQSNTYKMSVIQEIRKEIKEWQKQKELEQEASEDQQIAEPSIVEEPVIQKETVRISDLISVRTLSTEEDVDKYVNTLENKLKQ